MAVGDDNSTGLSFSDALAVIKGHIPKGYKVKLWSSYQNALKITHVYGIKNICWCPVSTDTFSVDVISTVYKIQY